MSAFYDEAEVYDLLHADGTAAELDAVLAQNAAYGNGGRRVLEPACGTGRYLALLAARGFAATGYDTNPRPLAFARRRLKGLGVRVLRIVSEGGKERLVESSYDLRSYDRGQWESLVAAAGLRVLGRSGGLGGELYALGR